VEGETVERGIGQREGSIEDQSGYYIGLAETRLPNAFGYSANIGIKSPFRQRVYLYCTVNKIIFFMNEVAI